MTITEELRSKVKAALGDNYNKVTFNKVIRILREEQVKDWKIGSTPEDHFHPLAKELGWSEYYNTVIEIGSFTTKSAEKRLQCLMYKER